MYLTSITSTALDLSAPRLVAILDALRGPLESHFNDEVRHIASLAAHARTLVAGSAAERATVARFDKWGPASLIEPSVTDVLVFFLLSMDRAYEEGRWRDAQADACAGVVGRGQRRKPVAPELVEVCELRRRGAEEGVVCAGVLRERRGVLRDTA